MEIPHDLYSLDTQVMLILVLINVQYSQRAIFKKVFETGSTGQKHSSSGSYCLEKFPISPTSYHFLPLLPPLPYLDFSGIAEEHWGHFLKRIGDILIKLHDTISEFWLRSGKLDSDWNKLIFQNHKVHLMKIGGPLDHSDGVSTHKLSNKKVYTERVYCPPQVFCVWK